MLNRREILKAGCLTTLFPTAIFLKKKPVWSLTDARRGDIIRVTPGKWPGPNTVPPFYMLIFNTTNGLWDRSIECVVSDKKPFKLLHYQMDILRNLHCSNNKTMYAEVKDEFIAFYTRSHWICTISIDKVELIT